MASTPLLPSFIEGADSSSFPLNNLPYGIITHEKGKTPRGAVAIGDYVIDLSVLEKHGLLLKERAQSLFDKPTLNDFAAQGAKVWAEVRERLQALLGIHCDDLKGNQNVLSEALLLRKDVVMKLPFAVSGYTDFYASEHHATNVGTLFRGRENALLPNWKCLPVAYNGRASTVFLSGTDIKRPRGQIKLPDQDIPLFAPCRKLDFELEMGFFLGTGNPTGQPITIDNARSHIFGMVLLNDWSARDIQAFEYQPLGPFLAKSFATSISPWVVPMAALEDFMVPLGEQNPNLVEYLRQDSPMLPDIKLKVELQTQGSDDSSLLCETGFQELYWSMEQMLAHHCVNNCVMQTGDLLASGTVSGPNRENWGSLLEISANGSEPFKLANGEERSFLQDGDRLTISGHCEDKDYKIGFGSVEGMVVGV